MDGNSILGRIDEECELLTKIKIETLKHLNGCLWKPEQVKEHKNEIAFLNAIGKRKKDLNTARVVINEILERQSLAWLERDVKLSLGLLVSDKEANIGGGKYG